MCVCVCLYLLHTVYQSSYSTSKVRTLLESEHIFAGPHNCRGEGVSWGAPG